MSNQSDLELVKKVQQGDTRAFDLLVIKYQRRLISLLSRIIHNPAEAEEVAQESFIKAYRYIHQFRMDSSFYTWLYRIAINTAKTWLAKEKLVTVPDEVMNQEGETFSQIDSLSDSDTPETLLIQQQLQDMANQAIEELPEELRTAFVLREAEGLSYDEIATLTNSPSGTVRSRIFRAREAVAKKLQPYFDMKIR